MSKDNGNKWVKCRFNKLRGRLAHVSEIPSMIGMVVDIDTVEAYHTGTTEGVRLYSASEERRIRSSAGHRPKPVVD